MQVKNVSKRYANYKYAVIRNVDGEYWYYAAYNDLSDAMATAQEIGNGTVTETAKVEPEYFNSFC